jgi:hypothetical protein
LIAPVCWDWADSEAAIADARASLAEKSAAALARTATGALLAEALDVVIGRNI